MWPLSGPAQRTLTQTHSMTVRATAYGPYGTRTIPVAGGSVTSDAKSQVRRTATLLTSLALWPVNPRSVIGVYGTEIQIDYGIVIPGRSDPEWIPLIRGLVSKGQRQKPIPSDGIMPLQLVDRSARVAEDIFTTPTQTIAGALVVNEIRRLIQETLGTGVTVVDKTGSTQVAPLMDIEQERWADGVETLADSIGAEVFADPLGNFIIRPQPKLTDNSVWLVSSGVGGTLIEYADEITREDVYSGVVARGERTDGTAPATATVWDTDPNSPTYYLGPFGRKPRIYSSPLLTTTGQCTTAAAALLERYRGGDAKTTPAALVNPALEAGDVVSLRDEGITKPRLLDKVVTPLNPKDLQPLEGRSVA